MKIFLLITLLYSSFSFSATIEKINSLVHEYYTQNLNSMLLQNNLNHDCEPHYPFSCLQEVCQKVSSSYCNDVEDIKKINNICKNQNSGRCLNVLCSKFSINQCSDLNKISKVLTLCEDTNGYGYDVACKYLRRMDCNEPNDFPKIQSLIKDKTTHQLECLNYACSRVSNLDCDTIGELKIILDSCSN